MYMLDMVSNKCCCDIVTAFRVDAVGGVGGDPKRAWCVGCFLPKT